jgi:hypothetical protein
MTSLINDFGCSGKAEGEPMRAEIWAICGGPFEEALAMVGDPNFSEQNLKECVVFAKQLERASGEAPAKSDLIIESEIHDFGVFCTVAIRFDPDDRDALAFAERVENGLARWDEISLNELGR